HRGRGCGRAESARDQGGVVSEWISSADRFLFEERSGRPLAVFRAAFGVFLLIYFASLYPYLRMHFGAGGILSPDDVQATIEAPQLSVFAWLPRTQLTFLAAYALMLAGALGLATGRFIRISATLVWIFNASWINAVRGGANSGDNVVAELCFLF